MMVLIFCIVLVVGEESGEWTTWGTEIIRWIDL